MTQLLLLTDVERFGVSLMRFNVDGSADKIQVSFDISNIKHSSNGLDFQFENGWHIERTHERSVFECSRQTMVTQVHVSVRWMNLGSLVHENKYLQ